MTRRSGVVVLLASAALLGAAAPAFRLESPAFKNGEELPRRFTCGGNVSSPPLSWSDPPDGARSYALIFAEQVVGALRVHWVVYNIPAAARTLESKHVWRWREKDGTLQGTNTAGRSRYSPPCPKSEHPPAERFTLYALDVVLPDQVGLDASQLASRMKGHVLARAELATYEWR